MKLRELLNGVPVASCAVDLEMEINGVSYDSRATQPGDLFVAMTGYATDGHKYIATALEKGAAAVLCQNLPEGDGPYIRTADSRRALAVIGANWFGHPAEEMTMIAVTGTCGKTTTTYLLKAILEQVRGAKVGLIGTNQLLKLPEFRDADKAHELMSFLADDKEKLPVPDEGPIKILIGPENVNDALKDTSVVVASYDIGDDMRGLIGVVGPTRMDYATVAARLTGFADGLTRLFGKQEKQELPPKEDTDT